MGQTIVISRGLLDVLPDEASLAMVLAAELAHIALGHRNDTHFSFYDQTMLPDEELLNRLQLTRPAEQIASAAEKTFALLSQSPYKDKMGTASLFLKAVASRAPAYPNLIRANLGNQIAGGEGLLRLQALADRGPALDDKKLDQIAALPAGIANPRGPMDEPHRAASGQTSLTLVRSRQAALRDYSLHDSAVPDRR